MSKPTGQVRTNRMEVDRAAVDAVILKAGRDKPVRQRHPWIFSGAIQRLPKAAADGEIVEIYTAEGHWLARGYLNRASQIQVRILTWNEGEAIDRAFWQRRIAQAIAARTALATDPDTTVYRLINAESDYLPGLTVDRYDAYLVMQIGTLAMEQRKTELAELLVAATGARGVLERSEASVRRQEGLTDTDGLLAGEAPPEHVVVHEDGLHFMVDLYGGQKGGFYADQRENRRRVAAYCSGKRVLNGFSYTAAFAVHALAAGAAKVINIDSSVDALTLGEENLRLNGFDPDQDAESLAGDLFTILRDWRDEDVEHFDLIILDPPKFAQSRSNVDRALRGYKDINLLALQLLKPGGILATFSCKWVGQRRSLSKGDLWRGCRRRAFGSNFRMAATGQ
ncbi:MAG: class I SAM-dependent rRNA methyltransferase [Caldilineaceae bacterium]